MRITFLEGPRVYRYRSFKIANNSLSLSLFSWWFDGSEKNLKCCARGKRLRVTACSAIEIFRKTFFFLFLECFANNLSSGRWTLFTSISVNKTEKELGCEYDSGSVRGQLQSSLGHVAFRHRMYDTCLVRTLGCRISRWFGFFCVRRTTKRWNTEHTNDRGGACKETEFTRWLS